MWPPRADDLVDRAEGREPLHRRPSGRSVSTSRSRSPIVSSPAPERARLDRSGRRRRRAARSATRSSRCAWARWISSRRGGVSSFSMPSRIRCSVLAEMPLSSAGVRLGRLQLLEGRDPEPLPEMRTVLGPTPGIRSSSTRLAGISAAEPLVVRPCGRSSTSSTILSLIASPTPGIGRPVARPGRRATTSNGAARDRVGRPVVGDGLELDLALDLEDVADLVEDPREVAVGHRAARRSSPSAVGVGRRPRRGRRRGAASAVESSAAEVRRSAMARGHGTGARGPRLRRTV